MSLAGTFIANLKTTLELALPPTIFKLGKLEGPVEHAQLGGIWCEEESEDPRNVVWELLDVRVRLFRQYRQVQDVTKQPYDPVELYDLADELRTALLPVAATQLGVDFFRVTAVRYLPDAQGIEARIYARAENVFALV